MIAPSRNSLLGSAALLLLLGGATAQAQTVDGRAAPLPRHRLVYDNLLAARINPLGLEDQLSVGYRYRLYRDPGPLWRDGYLGLAFTPTVNPAEVRVGATLEVRPLTILSFSVGYYFVEWFGSFGFLQSYASPHAAHADSDIEAGGDAGRSYAAPGSELQLGAQLLGKLGPIVARSELTLLRSDLALRGGDRLSYNSNIDAMVADRGWALAEDTDLLWLSKFGLVAGVRASVVHAFYDDALYLPGERTENPNTPTVRVGPLLAYVFYDRGTARFDRPTLLLIANWWLRHRYRTGADVSQAIPYVVLAFKFEGELWQRR